MNNKNHGVSGNADACLFGRHAAIKAFVLAAILVLNVPQNALAEDERQLEEMLVKSDKPAVPANVPSTTESVTARQIAESVNSVSSAGALQYVPSVHVRERFIGDVNGGLAMRMYGVNSSAETIVYADGLLLSNFLNNSCCPGPRWALVPQHAIDRVDVMYGPFSALYPGNSVGGVVLMSTHMPTKFEAHAQLDAFTENFKLYGTDKSFNGAHAAATVGNKAGDWSFWLSADRLDNHSHPTDYTSAIAKTGAPAAAGQYTVVTGAHFDRDIGNKPRVITAATSLDHTVKDDATLKVAYDFSPTVRAAYTFGSWQNTSTNRPQSYLRNAAGAAATSGAINIDGRSYAAVFAAGNPSYTEGFGPALPGYKTLPYGDLEAFKAAVGPNTAAVIVEPVQGEGGARALGEAELKAMREHCTANGVLVIYDEIQCGLGRTGKLFAHEWVEGAAPDIMCVAKALGNGFPVGACLATIEAAKGMTVGSHGSTYGGNPLAMAVGLAAFGEINKPETLENVRTVAGYFTQGLKGLQDRYPDVITDIRGKGLLIGVKLAPNNREFMAAARDEKLLIAGGGDNCVRLLPSLLLTPDEAREAIEKLERTCEAMRKKAAA